MTDSGAVATTVVEETPKPAAGSLDRSLVRSIAWTAGAKWSGQIVTSGITLLIARILTPADYGLLGMGAVFLGFVRFISQFGVGAAVIITRETNPVRLARLNAFALLCGLVGFSVTAAAAFPLGQFFGTDKLPPVLLISALGFVITAFGSVPGSVLARDLRFRLLATIDVTQALVAAFTTLGLALAGAGYWSLVFGNLIAVTLSTGIIVFKSPQKFAWPDMGELRPAFSISHSVVISSMAWYVYSNADFLVVGRVLGQSALGLYNIGWTVAMLIVERVTSLIGGVTPAYLSAMKHDLGELRRYLFRITESISLITFPVSLGLSLVAADFCTTILGARWTGAIQPLRLLAVYAGIRSLAPIVPQILTVVGEHKFVAKNSVASAIGMPLAFWLGARWGVSGVAWAWVLAYPVIALPIFARGFRALEVRPADYFQSLKPAFVSAATMVAAVLALRLVLPQSTAPVLRLALTVVVGAAVYGGTLLIGFRSRIGALKRALRPASPTPA
jgi:PST family polysaccharide transporter